MRLLLNSLFIFLIFISCYSSKSKTAIKANDNKELKTVVAQYASCGCSYPHFAPTLKSTVVLELYTDSSFMLVGALNSFSPNEYRGVSCFKGFFEVENDKLFLDITFRQMSYYGNAAQNQRWDRNQQIDSLLLPHAYNRGVGLPNLKAWSDIMNFSQIDSLNRVVMLIRKESIKQIQFSTLFGGNFFHGLPLNTNDSLQNWRTVYLDTVSYLTNPIFKDRVCPDISFFREVRNSWFLYYKDSLENTRQIKPQK